MSSRNAVLGKSELQTPARPAAAPTAKALTEAWRKRVKRIRLKRTGQKRLTLHQLYAEGRR